MSHDASGSVVGPGGNRIALSAGDPWTLPFRGSRYSLKDDRGVLKAVWATADEILPSDSLPRETAAALGRVGKTRGSFRLTAHGAIITKVAKDSDGPWRAIYVGRYSGDLKFSGVDLNPSGLKMGMYWTGLPFKHGEVWAVSPRPGANGILTWKGEGVTLGSSEPYPDLFRTYLAIRPRGGRLHFTETGHVWMNLPDDEISVAYRDEFRRRQSSHIDALAAGGQGTALRLIQLRFVRTSCRPIYLGRTKDFDCGEAPWTAFTEYAASKFGQGGESAGDGDLVDGEES